MKKSLYILSIILIATSLTAIGIVGKTDSKMPVNTSRTIDKKSEQPFRISNSFAYDVSSRFKATISKKDLESASSILDLLPVEANWMYYPIQNIHIKRLSSDSEVIQNNGDFTLNKVQKAFLRTINYSDNFQVIANSKGDRKPGGGFNTFQLTYFITVVPEKEAEYIHGKDELHSFLKINSEPITAFVESIQSGAGKVMFTVDTEGNVSNLLLKESSGNPFVDQNMIGTISKTSGMWKSATNEAGEKVEQILMFSFGNLGC